ncbi:MAG: single-stranded DNA-binding protein [Taibaiella sp.]|nr:single-stranded DNA-binding protein [Taibaiella sp.]
MNITGRLTRNAELNTTKNGKTVVNFSIAVNESYKNKQGERVEQTSYFNCAYWKSAKVLNMLTKGLLVELTGNVSARAWVSSDGEAKASLNFHTSNIKPLAGGRKSDPIQANTEPSNEVEKDDLPF